MYGVKDMPLEEELNLPETVSEIRRVKYAVGKYCDNMQKLLDQIRFRAENMSEIDNFSVVLKVETYCSKVESAFEAVEKAAMYGIQ